MGFEQLVHVTWINLNFNFFFWIGPGVNTRFAVGRDPGSMDDFWRRARDVARGEGHSFPHRRAAFDDFVPEGIKKVPVDSFF